jgi:branched-chain amino acid transport system ATP-binding protein
MRPTLARCILEEKASGKIIILIEHDMGVIRSLADKVALLNRGMLIREGTPADVIQGEEILDAYAE